MLTVLRISAYTFSVILSSRACRSDSTILLILDLLIASVVTVYCCLEASLHESITNSSISAKFSLFPKSVHNGLT